MKALGRTGAPRFALEKGYGDFGAPAAAVFALCFASFFARLAIPVKSFFALFFLRLVSSILE